MMAEVTRQLAACGDAATVAKQLRAALPDLATIQARHAAVDDVVSFLTASEERWAVTTQTLISDLSGETSEREMQLELLDDLLAWAAQEAVQKNNNILEILLQFFHLATTRLGEAGDMRRWLKWGGQVLAVVHQNAALIEKKEPVETKEDEQEDSGGSRCYVVKIATLLMQLRNKLEGGDGATPDLKPVTFVWKVVVAREI